MSPRNRIFDRYQRVYVRSLNEYANVIAPGPDPTTVLIAQKSVIYPVSRRVLRPLRWYERLLNR